MSPPCQLRQPSVWQGSAAQCYAILAYMKLNSMQHNIITHKICPFASTPSSTVAGIQHSAVRLQQMMRSQAIFQCTIQVKKKKKTVQHQDCRVDAALLYNQIL